MTIKLVIKRIFLIIIFALFYSSTIDAQNVTKISVETDPLTYAYKGYSVHLKVNPTGAEKVLLGYGMLIGSLFTETKLPDFFINLNKKNKDKGWDVNIRGSYSLFFEYYFTTANEKWFIGQQSGIHLFRIENQSVPDTHSDFNQLMLMAYGGYVWHPFSSSLYIKPWFGVGFSPKINGINKVDNNEYNVSSITLFATFHIGYTF